MSFVMRSGRNRRGGRLGCLVSAFIFFITSLLIGLLVIFPGIQARLSGVKTQGVVVSVEACPEDSGGDVVLRSGPLVEFIDNVTPTVRFTDSRGLVHEVQDVVCGSYAIGEVLPLWYLPDHPTNYILDKNVIGVSIIGVILAVIVVVSGLVLLVYGVSFLFLLFTLARGSSRGNAAVMYSPAAMGGGLPMGNAPPLGAQVGGAALGGVNHQVGEVVSVVGRWAITLSKPYPSQGAGMAQAQPGRFFLLTPLSMRNTSHEPLHVGQTAFRLFDAAGAEYQRAKAMESALPGFIEPGEQAQMTLAYDVPGTTRQFRLSFYLSTSSLSQANWDFRV